ncbi:TPA: hypothetical protein N0F65_010297 [Lagenidium giganteum]|uniref:Uncharacterized protein n=1 Tax=Lagenidium giganteum TaxID=4803 RepID=A0AAV2Z2Q3_9STRA|nr:TPA: hypothetical protein N0F65_010297 [Lagenidium giganteum]
MPPVAMVNPVRPGFTAHGNFPGQPVRTAAHNQLATPLVAPRRSSTPHDALHPQAATGATTQQPNAPRFPPPISTLDDPFAALETPSLFPPPPFQQHGGDHGQQLAMSQQQPQPIDPFQSLDRTPFQVQGGAAADLFLPRVERSAPDSLFGSPPERSSLPSSLDSLFGGPAPNDGSQAEGGVVRHSQSFSYGQNSRPSIYQDDTSTSSTASSAQRTFGEPPPPAAPFLGYADPSRSQSYRASPGASSTSSVGAPERRNSIGHLSAPSTPSQGLQYRGSMGSLPQPSSSSPSPPRISMDVRTADELLEEFMNAAMDDGAIPPTLSNASVMGASGGMMAPPIRQLSLSDIPDAVHGLADLYRQKRWKTLTKKSLAMLQNPSNDARRTLEIKSWWLAGLIKEGHYDNATSVLDQVGSFDDAEAVCGHSYTVLRLRLLEALLSKYKGNLADHEKKLHELIGRLHATVAEQQAAGDVERSQSTRQWLRVAQFTLVNHLVQQNKFALALRVCAKVDMQRLNTKEKIVVLSRFGRIHLQMGDLRRAERFFALARKLGESSTVQSPQLQGRLLLNEGLLLFAQNKLQEALSAFDSILYLEVPPHAPATAHDVEGADEADMFFEEDLVGCAVNNYAICALYCCDVKGAVVALERMIRSNPVRFLNGVVVFNLSSLYDLIYDNVSSTNRKEMMKKVADMYELEHIDPAAFRI